MQDTSSSKHQQTILVAIALEPLEDEENDFETLSAVEEAKVSVLAETRKMQQYTSRLSSQGSRDSGLILLFHEMEREVIIQKDLLIALLEMGTIAIKAIVKQGHVKKIDLTLDGDSISIEGPDKATIQTLLSLFEAKHAGKAPLVTVSSTLQVTGKVSKNRRIGHSQ